MTIVPRHLITHEHLFLDAMVIKPADQKWRTARLVRAVIYVICQH